MSNLSEERGYGKPAPKVNLYQPDMSHWGPLVTEAYENPDQELLDEVKEFYDTMLIPELVCSPGRGPDRPHESWIMSEGKTLITVRREHGAPMQAKPADKGNAPDNPNKPVKNELLGCWVLKGGGIYYPCINIMKGAKGAMPILRALAYKSFELVGEEMHASTDNPLIQAWVNHATDTPEEGRPEKMPLPKFQNGRVEWRA